MNDMQSQVHDTVSHGAASTAGSAWRRWLRSPPGRYVLDWEQAQYDTAVADVFGYHALQCGLHELQCLRMNRMPNRVRADSLAEPIDEAGIDSRIAPWIEPVEMPTVPMPERGATADGDPSSPPVSSGNVEALPIPGLAGLSQVRIENFEELPFAAQSLDLVVLPHVLEFSFDPHQVLREVERVLRPEGRLIVSGFNPASLWGMRQLLMRPFRPAFFPRDPQFIGLPRLRDWLTLLGFELDGGRYGCYRPPCASQRWLDRTEMFEHAGDRWWPILGAIYFVSAVKRVRGMHLIGPAWRTSRAQQRAGAIVAPPVRTGTYSRGSTVVDFRPRPRRGRP